MEDQLISIDTAKLAKEKGCNLDLYSGAWSFTENGEVYSCNYDPREDHPNATEETECTQGLLQKWLREERDLHLTNWCEDQYKQDKEPRKYYYFIHEIGNRICSLPKIFNTYEESLEEGLIEALKLVPNKE